MNQPCFEVHICLNSPQPNTYDEILLGRVPQHGAQALIWQGSQGLVVPRSYSHNPLFKHSSSILSQMGWPIEVRQSGGGIVPQGPGIWNLSLSWRQYGKPLDLAQNAYLFICHIVQSALNACAIASSPQAVEGSFCDGRFNLAVKRSQVYQKIAGTAQVWRRGPTPAWDLATPHQPSSSARWHIGLVHAVLLLNVDENALTLKTNLVEQLLQSPRRYEADKICSLHRLNLCSTQFLQALQQQLEQQSPPHDAKEL